MAEADNVLGISGQMDISDIQASIDKLCNSLQQVGVNTDEMSERMTKALNDIAKSDGDLSAKTQAAMSVLKQAMDEAQKAASDVPQLLQQAQRNVESYQSSVTKLNDELANTSKKSEGYDALVKQLDNQKQALEASKQTLSGLTEAYGEYREAMGGVSGAYNALSAMATANAAAIGADAAASTTNAAAKTANAVASGTDAVATGADASAHTNNAQKIGEEAQAIKTLSETFAELKQKLVEGQLSEEDYQEAIKKGNDELSQRKEKIKDLKEQSMGGATVPISNEGGIPFSATVFAGEEYDKEMSRLEGEIEKEKTAADELKQSIVSLQEAHDGLKTTQETTTQTTQQTTTANDEYTEAIYNATEKYKQAQQALDEYREELKAIAEETGQDIHAFKLDNDQAAKWKELNDNVAATATHVTELNEASKSGSLPAYGKVLEENLATAKQELQTFLDEIKQVQSSMGESGQIGLSGELSEQWQQLKQNIADAQQKVNDFKASFDSTEEGMIVKLTELQNKLEELQAQKNQALYGTDSPNIIQRAVGNYEFNTGVENGTVSDEEVNKIETLQQQIDATKEKIAEVKEQLASLGENSSVEEQSTSFENYGASITALKDSIADAKQRLEEYEAEYDKLANKENLTDKQQKELEELGNKITQTKQDIADMKDQLREKSGNTFFGSIRNSLNDFKEDVKGVGTAIKENINDAWDKLTSKVSSSGFGQRFSAEFSQVKGTVNDAASSFANFLTGNGKVQESLNNLSKAMGGLGIPLTGALTGIKAVTKALWAMCATPIGAILTVIVLGLKAVHTWMTKSSEGQRVYTKLMAYFGSIAASVTDLIILLGKWIYHLFADNMGPMNAFGKAFVTTFKTAIETVYHLLNGLGTTLKGIFTGSWTDIKSGLSLMWDGVKGIGNTVISAFDTAFKGISGVLGTIKTAFTDTKMQNEARDIIANMGSNADKAAKNAERQLNAEREISESKKHQAELDIQIAENREKIYQLSGQEKIDMIQKTKELMKQKYLAWDEKKANGEIVHHKGVIAAMEEEANLQAEKNNMHAASLQDIAKERELRTAVLRTQAQSAASTRMLTRQEEAARRSLERQNKSADKAAATQAKKNARQTEQTQQAQGKYDDTLYQNDQAREKVITDLEQKLADAKIAAMQEGFARTQAERKRQQEKELQQLQEQEESAVAAELKRVKAEFDAQNAVRKAQGNSQLQWNSEEEAKNIENTEDVKNIRKMYAELRQLTVQKQVEDEKKAADQLIEAHQSYTDKKLAIDKQYKEDLAAIDAAIVEAEKRGDQERADALKRSREETIKYYANQQAQLKYQQISAGIDWKTLFSGVNNISVDMLKPILSQLNAYTKTDEFAKADSQTQKDIIAKIDEIRQYIGPDKNESRDQDVANLAGLIAEFNIALSAFNQAREIEAKANSNLAQADKDLSEGKITQDQYDEIKKAATKATEETDKARKKVQQFGNEVNNAQDKIKGWSSEMTAALEKAGTWKNVEGVNDLTNASKGFDTAVNDLRASIAQKDKDGNAQKDEKGNYIIDESDKTTKFANTLAKGLESTLGSIGNGIADFIKTGIWQIVGFFAQIPRLILQFASAIKNTVTGVLDSFSELLSFSWLEDLVNSILNAVGNLINVILDLPENLWHVLSSIVVNGVGGLLNTIVGRLGNIFSFGTLSSKGPSSWFTNSNAKKVADTTEKLTERNKLLQQSIDDLKDTIDNTKGVGAITATEQAVKLQKETNENYKKIAEAQAGYHGHHHSWNYYWNGFSQEEIDSLNDQFQANGLDNNWTGNLFDLSPEQMKILRENADIWQRILDTGKGGYGDRLGEKLDDYIDQAGKLEEITDQLNETLTTTTKQNIFDDFLNSLNDLADGSQEVFDDIADDWQKMVNKMVVNNLVGAKFKDRLNKWFDELADLQKKKTNGEISDAEYKRKLDELKRQREDMLREAQDEIDTYRDEGIIQDVGNAAQNATAKGVTSITYDQANLLVNLATARNIALEQGNAVRNLIQIDTTQLRITTLQIQSDISVMRDIQEQGLTQITRIEANTRPISEILAVVNDLYRVVKDNA